MFTQPLPRTPGAAVSRRTPPPAGVKIRDSKASGAPTSNQPRFQTATQLPSFVRQAHNSDLRRILGAAFRLDSPLTAQCLLAGKKPVSTDEITPRKGLLRLIGARVLQYFGHKVEAKSGIRSKIWERSASEENGVHPSVQAWKLGLQALADLHQSFLLPIDNVSLTLQDLSTRHKCRIEMTPPMVACAISRLDCDDVTWLSAEALRELEVDRSRARWTRRLSKGVLAAGTWLFPTLTSEAIFAGSYLCCNFVLDETLQWVLQRLEFEKAGGTNATGCRDYLHNARIAKEEEFVLTDLTSLTECALMKFAEIRKSGVASSVLRRLVTERLETRFLCVVVDDCVLVPIGSTSPRLFIRQQLLGGSGEGIHGLSLKIQALKRS